MLECNKHCAVVFYFLLPLSVQLKTVACSEYPIVALIFNHITVKGMYGHNESRCNVSCLRQGEEAYFVLGKDMGKTYDCPQIL